jgi:hypothetical protein
MVCWYPSWPVMAGRTTCIPEWIPNGKPHDWQPNMTGSGFYVFFGMGAGYGLEALLSGRKVSKGIIVEYDARTLRAILERIDVTHVLGNRRLTLLVDPDDGELADAVMSRYIPSINGDLVTVPLRSLVDAFPVQYHKAADLVRNLTGGISDDYSVQSFFGKRWFSNIVRNLRSAADPDAAGRPGQGGDNHRRRTFTGGPAG